MVGLGLGSRSESGSGSGLYNPDKHLDNGLCMALHMCGENKVCNFSSTSLLGSCPFNGRKQGMPFLLCCPFPHCCWSPHADPNPCTCTCMSTRASLTYSLKNSHQSRPGLGDAVGQWYLLLAFCRTEAGFVA